MRTLAVVLAAAGLAADWPQWRGPNRDGVAGAAPARWPAELREVWKVEVGEGHSGPVVVGDRVFAHSRVGGEEVLRCLKLADGSQVWESRWKSDAELDGAVGWHGKFPRSTPCVSGGRVYTLSIDGSLSCFRADTGKLAWRKAFAGQFPKTWPLYGPATSPLVEGGKVIVWVGGHDGGALQAFDAESGSVRWSLPLDGPGYASPVIAQLASRRQLVTQSQKLLVGVDPAAGKALWTQKFTTGYDQNSVTPLVVGDTVLYSGYQKSLHAAFPAAPGGKWSLVEAWEAREHALYMSSPVLAGGRVVAFSMKDGGTLVVLDPKTGREVWRHDANREYAAFVVAGDRVFMQLGDGKAVVFDPSAAKYEPLAEYSVGPDRTWAHPALTGDRLLTKGPSHLTCWALDGAAR